MATNWAYHFCLRCQKALTPPGDFWCDKCDAQADDELDTILAGGQ